MVVELVWVCCCFGFCYYYSYFVVLVVVVWVGFWFWYGFVVRSLILLWFWLLDFCLFSCLCVVLFVLVCFVRFGDLLFPDGVVIMLFACDGFGCLLWGLFFDLMMLVGCFWLNAGWLWFWFAWIVDLIDCLWVLIYVYLTVGWVCLLFVYVLRDLVGEFVLSLVLMLFGY